MDRERCLLIVLLHISLVVLLSTKIVVEPCLNPISSNVRRNNFLFFRCKMLPSFRLRPLILRQGGGWKRWPLVRRWFSALLRLFGSKWEKKILPNYFFHPTPREMTRRSGWVISCCSVRILFFRFGGLWGNLAANSPSVLWFTLLLIVYGRWHIMLFMWWRLPLSYTIIWICIFSGCV